MLFFESKLDFLARDRRRIMALYCEIEDLANESDVEQKFLYPFLKNIPPVGLGLKDVEILTKHMLRPRLIDKGKKQKYYYPDYLITIRGIPILVIEAKSPEAGLEDGFFEARLYATEVNASFPHKVNVCQYVIASNGKETWLGYADQAEPSIRLTYNDFSVENKKFSELISAYSHEKLLGVANKYYVEARGSARFHSPVSQLGGKRIQNEEMVENSFGRTIVFENRTIFDPESEEDRTEIVKNAYIPSHKREQHIEPIYKEIKRFDLSRQDTMIQLDTDNPNELITKLSERIINKQDAYSLMLLIGNVGSGKTTFTRYFKQVFLAQQHPDLFAKCEWVFLNMNSAPVEKGEIYFWLKTNIISHIKKEHRELDFDSIEIIKRVFRREIIGFDKGIGSLLKGNEFDYNKALYEKLHALIQDQDAYLVALLFFIKENYSKIPIIVLDNCDKRNKDEQLLMFEVAQWLRTQYQCLVFLPMRDTTYDIYKSEPPLDTVVRDLVFRIDPPDLLKVLQARLDYIIRITEMTSSAYLLENGIQVAVKRSELIEYFKQIMMAIRKDRWIADIFYRLSNKNTRNGIQIFEDFCKSGHMRSDDILAMRILGDEASVPRYKFFNVILRKNRRFYNGDESNFINLFASDYDDDFPDPFVRVDILFWLRSVSKREGVMKEKGLFSISSLNQYLQFWGHNYEIILRELAYLIQKGLVYCENINGKLEVSDLIKINIPGLLHLNMLGNVMYLAACAEDTLFKNTTIMTEISNRLKNINEKNAKLVCALNARDLVKYLSEYRKEYIFDSAELLGDTMFVEPYDMSESSNAIQQFIKHDPQLREEICRIERYVVGTKVEATVAWRGEGSIICSLGEGDGKGFIATKNQKYALSDEMFDLLQPGVTFSCQIIDYSYAHQSFQLKFDDDNLNPVSSVANTDNT